MAFHRLQYINLNLVGYRIVLLTGLNFVLLTGLLGLYTLLRVHLYVIGGLSYTSTTFSSHVPPQPDPQMWLL